MNISAYVASDLGQRRSSNEDQYLVDESLGLYIVCDGMGGRAAGEVAAERSITFAAEYIREHRQLLEAADKSPGGYQRVLELAETAVQDASRRLYEIARSDPSRTGMGTTMTLLLVVDDKAVMAHVGDSRLYILRRGEVHQLSSDHTLANELLQQGVFTIDDEALNQYNHVLTRTIGQQELVQVESLLYDLIPGDVCMLCTDGLSNYFDDAATAAEYLSGDDLASVPNRLVEFANSKGGADNVTLVVLRVSAEDVGTNNEDVQDQLDVLKSTFLCRKLSVSRLMRVLNITSLIQCATNQTLFSAGQACDGLYIVLDGRFKIQDDDLLSGDLVRGDVVGASSLLRRGKIYSNIVALEPSKLMFISRSEFKKTTRQLSKFGNMLLRNLGQYLSKQLDEDNSRKLPDPGDTAPFDFDSYDR